MLPPELRGYSGEVRISLTFRDARLQPSRHPEGAPLPFLKERLALNFRLHGSGIQISRM
jgi:hypothetical protein